MTSDPGICLHGPFWEAVGEGSDAGSGAGAQTPHRLSALAVCGTVSAKPALGAQVHPCG